MCQEGLLTHDESQDKGARILEALLPDPHLRSWSPSQLPDDLPPTDHDAEAAPEADPPVVTVRGAYLHGPVGSGKSLLMDLFAAECGDLLGASALSRRCHFHEFMHEIHGHLHRLQARHTTMGSALGAPRVGGLCAERWRVWLRLAGGEAKTCQKDSPGPANLRPRQPKRGTSRSLCTCGPPPNSRLPLTMISPLKVTLCISLRTTSRKRQPSYVSTRCR